MHALSILSYLKSLINRNYEVLSKHIKDLKIEDYSSEIVCGKRIYVVTLANNKAKILGEAAGRRVRLNFCHALAKGVNPLYLEAISNAITRYNYAHMLSGAVSIKGYNEKRMNFFHPQHYNLISHTSEDLNNEERDELTKRFTPQKGWNILDVGSYIGIGAVRLSHLMEGTGRIVCVEANSSNIMLARHNFKINNCSNIKIIEGAIWKKCGEEIPFYQTNRQVNAIDQELVSSKKSEFIKAVSIPGLVEEFTTAIDLLSLTVNGAEVEAIEGMQSLSKDQLPKRILSAGWYTKNEVPRWKIIKPMLTELGYQSYVTKGGLILAWL